MQKWLLTLDTSHINALRIEILHLKISGYTSERAKWEQPDIMRFVYGSFIENSGGTGFLLANVSLRFGSLANP